MTRISRKDLVCVFILFMLSLAVYAPCLFGGKVLLPADTVLLMRPWGIAAKERFPDFHFAQNQMHGPIFEYYSWRYYARERIRIGEIPLWNPNEMGGNVLLGNNQSAVLYPPNLLLYIFSLPVGINLVTALHTFLTGLFLFGLLRALGLRQAGAMTGALIWMFCALQTVWIEFQTPTAVLCWLPAALWAWEVSRQRKSWQLAVFGSGSAVGMMFAAGHLHFAFYGILAFCLYAAWRSWSEHGRMVLMLAGAITAGIAFAAPTLLPVVEMGHMNFRAANTYTGSVAMRLPAENLLTLVIPDLLGNPRDYITVDAEGRPAAGHSYIGHFDFIEYACYIGVAGLLLALVGIYGAVRKRLSHDRYFALIALLGLLLALGTPICAFFYYGVPGYRQFNATARALCLFSFGMAALAGYGVDLLTNPDEITRIAARRWAGWIAGVIMLAGLAAFPGMGLVRPTLFSDLWFGYEGAALGTMTLFLLLTGAAIWLGSRKTGAKWIVWLFPLVAAADLLVSGAGFNPMTDPGMLGGPTRVTDILKTTPPDRSLSLECPGGGKDRGIHSLIAPNYNAVCGYREVQGADSLHTKRYHEIMRRVNSSLRPGSDLGDPNTLHLFGADHPILNLLNVRWITTVPDVPLDPLRFKKVADAELTVWENPRAMGRAWITEKADMIYGVDEAYRKLVDPAFDPHLTALLEKDTPPMDTGASAGRVTITGFLPQRVDVAVDSRGRGLLVLSETAYPGWHAYINGRTSPVITADYLLRATPVPAGRSEVVFKYEPTSYRLGLYLAAMVTLCLCGSLGAIVNWDRRYHRQ